MNIDNHKLQYHPGRVSQWKEEGDCYPIYVEIGPTNLCNNNCIFCALDWVGKNKDFIDKEVMVSTLKDMAEKGVRSVMFAGEGEPFLHKDICLSIKKAGQLGIDVSVTTNGVLFTKEKIKEIMPYLSWIRISVDAGTAKTHSEIHKTNKEDFNKIISNIKEAVKFKRKFKLETVIGIQFLLIPQNFKEVRKFVKLFKQIGVNNVQIKPYSQHPNSINKFVINYKDYAPLGKELKKSNSKNFQVFFREQTIRRLRNTPYPYCYGLPFFALIDAKGNVLPCNLFYNNEEFTYGNLNKNSFSQIWEGKKRKEVLNKLKKRGCAKCREGCRLDVINRYLHRIKNPEEHDNFI